MFFFRGAVRAQRCAAEQYQGSAMTDDELAALIAQTAAVRPNTSEGIHAMFALAGRLGDEPEFATLRVICSGRGSHTFTTDFVAQRMLKIARETGNPAAGVAWFRRASQVSKAIGGAAKALYGVKCSGPVPITDTVVLLPFLSVPASEIRDWIIADCERANEAVSLRGITPYPDAGLYRAGALEPVFADAKTTPSDCHASVWFDELDEAALLLALVPRAIPSEAAHWLHMDDPAVALLVQFGISRSNSSDVQPSPNHVAPEIREAQVKGLVPAYRKLQKRHRDRVALAIRRLVRGRCQSNPGNRAIDVATALEVLFMNTERDEHSYKISLRAARLLREEVAARRRVFAEVRNVYDVRSGMVHTGSADNESMVDGVKRTAHDVVEAVDVLCTEAIRKFLAMGSIPESWRDIELS
jgi:Apea-like HEPN